MLQWAFSTCLIFLAAFAFLASSSPTWQPSQPIPFSHKVHLDYFRDGRHRDEMVAMHHKTLMQALEDEEIVDEMIVDVKNGVCMKCHGDFDRNVGESENPEKLVRLGHCAQCHRFFLNHNLQGDGQGQGDPWREMRPCMGCHRDVVQSPTASIPNINTCAACHPIPLQGDDGAVEPKPEEAELLAYIEREETIPWARVYDYLTGEIVFSHERHVALGHVMCQECHGPVERAERPLALDVTLSMEDCMNCHASAGADNDCLACHK